MHLTQRSASLHEGAAVAQFVVILFRQGFTCFPVTGHAHQGLAIKAPVLHELTGKLHCVPFHVINSGGLGMFHRGEHVLKPMPELMEEGLNLFKTHQAWDVSGGWGLIANQVCHRVGELTLRIARTV